MPQKGQTIKRINYSQPIATILYQLTRKLIAGERANQSLWQRIVTSTYILYDKATQKQLKAIIDSPIQKGLGSDDLNL